VAVVTIPLSALDVDAQTSVPLVLPRGSAFGTEGFALRATTPVKAHDAQFSIGDSRFSFGWGHDSFSRLTMIFDLCVAMVS
jgi:hypothetical protein